MPKTTLPKRPLLHRFDRKLCNYVRGSFGCYLIGAQEPTRRTSADLASTQKSKTGQRFDPMARYSEVGLTDGLARWFCDQLPEPLWDYIWSAKDPPLLLTQEEFDSLASATDVGLQSSGLKWNAPEGLGWTTWPGLHRNYVLCMPEIEQELSRAKAMQFSEMSEGLIACLEREGLSLAEGTNLIADWVREIRRLIHGMGHAELLPPPEGYHNTPTIEIAPPQSISEKYAEQIERIRAAIANTPAGTYSVGDKLIEKAKVRKADGYIILAMLKEAGEYHGPAADEDTD